MDKPKMNKMVEIAMQNKAFRESYQKPETDQQKVSVTFFKNKENFIKPRDFELH